MEMWKSWSKSKKAFVVVFCLSIFILSFLSAYLLLRGLQTPSSSKTYLVVVDSMSDVKWHGTIGYTNRGSYESYSVDGKGTQTYYVTGEIISVVFQKLDEYGYLTVSIKDIKGNILKSQTTTAPFGVISIAYSP